LQITEIESVRKAGEENFNGHSCSFFVKKSGGSMFQKQKRLGDVVGLLGMLSVDSLVLRVL
jgi:hypothetical protein